MVADAHLIDTGVAEILTESMRDKNEETVREERRAMYAMYAGAWAVGMVLNALYVYLFAAPDAVFYVTLAVAPAMVALARPLREPTYSRHLYLPGLWLLAGMTFFCTLHYEQPVFAMFLLLPGVFLAIFYWYKRVLTAVHLVVLTAMSFATPILLGVAEPLRTAALSAPVFATALVMLGYLGAHANRLNVTRSRFESTIASLLMALQERDGQIAEDAREVEGLSVQVAERLCVCGDHMKLVVDSARLHDVGKIGIPCELLDKPAALSADEWLVMRTHPEIGERIVSTVPGFDDVAIVIRHTHERWDGNGYPDNLSETQIPLASRIIFACDAYEAMVSPRPFRGPLTHEEACAELQRGAGAQFDPKVVAALLATLNSRSVDNVTQLRPAIAAA